jgi:pimeloyl-ACP methyl ester carboxylesterase
VTACHDRLAAQGIDLSAYGIGAHAADIEDLRVALGIKSWNLNTNGDASRVALEVARRYPGGVRSLIVDSPSVPSPDLLTVGPAALDLSISHVVAACAAEAACARKFPDAGAMIRNAITQLDSSPLTVDVSGTVDAIRLGHPIHLVVDGAALVRLIRAGLGGSGGASAGATLAMVQHVIDRKLGPDDAWVVGLSSDVGDCLGLRAICERPTLGVLYSMLCRDVAGAIDQAALTASIAGRPAYQDVFAPSPLIAPCDAWGIPTAATESSPPPLTGGVPTLVMRGAFDPFSAPLPDVAAATAGSANVYLVDVPNQSYNVLGYTECPRAIRNAWIDAPTSPPDLSCLPNIPSLTLAP